MSARGGVSREKIYRSLAKAAVEAALKCGAFQRKYFGKNLRVSEKKGAGLVTEVDVASEEMAMKVLKKSAPRFSFLAEESGISTSKQGNPQGRWIIDPLDGTTNYIHGFPMFCVSIGAEFEGELAAGVIYHPILKDLYVAIRRQGARLNGKRISVSRTRNISDSLLTTGFTVQKEKWLHAEIEAFERLSRIARAIRRPGSAALDLAYTARGVFDGFWERRLAPWDVAAGALLVHEAGGRVTQFNGEPFLLDGGEILASNAALYPKLREVLSPETCPIH